MLSCNLIAIRTHTAGVGAGLICWLRVQPEGGPKGGSICLVSDKQWKASADFHQGSAGGGSSSAGGGNVSAGALPALKRHGNNRYFGGLITTSRVASNGNPCRA